VSLVRGLRVGRPLVPIHSPSYSRPPQSLTTSISKKEFDFNFLNQRFAMLPLPMRMPLHMHALNSNADPRSSNAMPRSNVPSTTHPCTTNPSQSPLHAPQIKLHFGTTIEKQSKRKRQRKKSKQARKRKAKVICDIVS